MQQLRECAFFVNTLLWKTLPSSENLAMAHLLFCWFLFPSFLATVVFFLAVAAQCFQLSFFRERYSQFPANQTVVANQISGRHMRAGLSLDLRPLPLSFASCFLSSRIKSWLSRFINYRLCSCHLVLLCFEFSHWFSCHPLCSVFSCLLVASNESCVFSLTWLLFQTAFWSVMVRSSASS